MPDPQPTPPTQPVAIKEGDTPDKAPPTGKPAPATEKTFPSEEDPWSDIVSAHSSFLTHLECITEMFELVLPVLKRRDEERHARINCLGEEVEVETGAKKGRAFKSVEDIQEFLGHVRKMRKAEQMFRQSMITSIVSKFDAFVIQLLKLAFGMNSGWLKNPDKRLSYKDLLEIESLEKLKSEIIGKEVDSLMRDSHYEQVTFLDGKLKLGIQEHFDRWKTFLEITERRNLFVHTGGTVSMPYLENCKKWAVPIAERIKEGTLLSASDEHISLAVDCFYELSVRLLQASVRRLFPSSYTKLDSLLNNKSVELLKTERWDLAERIFEYALQIPTDLRTSGEMEYYFLINLCIALKFAGKDYRKRLHSVDWKPFHPKYHFAVAVLEDRFDDAAELMRNTALQQEVKEQQIKDWPLLREFRKSEVFQQAFREIYHKDFAQELLQDAEEEIKAEQAVDAATVDAPATEAAANNSLASGSPVDVPPEPIDPSKAER